MDQSLRWTKYTSEVIRRLNLVVIRVRGMPILYGVFRCLPLLLELQAVLDTKSMLEDSGNLFERHTSSLGEEEENERITDTAYGSV